ncbi:actin-1/3 [Plakobranchus ocellatus]|uniref:Actin-1/3 n=1 Tax=Plakobranchus ocellatus TaxID=259542 RepID=A0AAV3ZM93_9GAST|nr:actin-1/3 [Plakobranchus ocellatus]
MRCWTSTDQEYLCRKCRGGFDKGIKRLEEASHQIIQHLIKSADREALLGGDATVNMTDLPDTYASVDTDMNAYELLRRHDIRGRPLLTPGDGNCLFNSISIILICNTKMASELRYKTCIQMATRKDRVLEGHRNIDDLFIVSPDYDESLIACARATEFSSARTILGLSHVLQHKVISVYPPENGPSYEAVRILTTEFGSFQHELPLSILLMGPKKGNGKMWLPNHFLPIAPQSSDDDAAHDDEKQTEDGVCGGCDDDVLNDDGNVYEVDAGVDDYHADNDNNQIDNIEGMVRRKKPLRSQAAQLSCMMVMGQRQTMKLMILTT